MGRAVVPELRGVDEMRVRGTGTADAVALLDCLLGPQGAGSLPEGGAVVLTAAGRDRLLVAALVRTYGPTIASTVGCGACGSAFDVDFSLPQLLESQAVEDVPATATAGVRIPTGEDELAVAGLPVDEAEALLLERCLVGPGDCEASEAAMQAAAPFVDVDLDAKCPECDATQPVVFDVQAYFLAGLVQERARLITEVHLIASTYGWTLAEILNLPRSDRRQYAELISGDQMSHG